jgi:hypothetical protein
METQETIGDVVVTSNDLVVEPVEIEESTPQDADTDKQIEEETPAEKTFTQKELDEILEKKTAKLARQRDKERTERAAIEQELRRLQPPQKQTNEPQEGQFETAKEYAQAYAQWKFSQAEQNHRAKQIEKENASFSERVTDFKDELEDIPDFDYKKLIRLPLSDTAVEALLDSDIRVKLAVHLLANPSDVDRIGKLSPGRQASELGKLEAKLSSAPVKKVSQAPAPITPVTGKGSVTTADLYDPKFASNTDAWIAEYNRKQAEKRKR